MNAKVNDALIGKVIADRYRVTRLIGQGGMGAVYEVAHTRIRKRFAMKTLAAHLSGDEDALARFRREADIIATLNHPNIVNIVNWDVLDDGSPCMIMERLEGESLAGRLRRDGAMSWSEIGAIADPVLAALSVAHQAGVVHRDLKPQNIFLARDGSGAETPKLLDFGVSKMRDSQSFVTTDERMLGTPAYMSPEQAQGIQADVGPSTDVWAMGAILFEMVTGECAFVGASVPSILYHICHGEPRKVTDLRPDTPGAVASLLERTLSHNGYERVTECDVLRAELRSALEGVADLPVVTRKRAISEAALAATAPRLAMAPTTLGSSSGESIAVPKEEDPPERRSRWPLPLVGLGVLAGVVLLAVRMLGSGSRSPDSTAAVATPTDASTVSLAAPPDAAAIAEQVSPADAAPPAQVTITLESVPSKAWVVNSDGKRLGRTPYRVVMAQGSERALRLERTGYHHESVTLRGDRDHTERVDLSRKRGNSVRTEPHEEKNVRGKPSNPFANKGDN